MVWLERKRARIKDDGEAKRDGRRRTEIERRYPPTGRSSIG